MGADPSSPALHYLPIQLPLTATARSIRLWNTEAWESLKITLRESVLPAFHDMAYTTITAAEIATRLALFQADFDSGESTGADDCYVFEGTITSPGAYPHYRL